MRDDVLERIAKALERVATALERASGPTPEALSVEDAAHVIGVRPETIEHLIRTRRLAYAQLGHQRGRVIPLVALRELLRDNLQEALTGAGAVALDGAASC